MRVTFPALFDAFECGDDDCACRRSLRSAPASAAKSWKQGQFPFVHAEKAMLSGAAVVATGKAEPEKVADIPCDYPLAAVATPAGVELYFAALCPTARAAMVANVDAVDLARAEGGWRLPVQVFAAHHTNKLVRVDGDRTVPWRQFAQLREWLADIVADSKLAPLARLARLADTVEQWAAEGGVTFAVTHGLAPLTPRKFLAFRAHIESRLIACDCALLGTALGKYHPLLAELELDDPKIKAIQKALRDDWRDQASRWLVNAEADLGPALETYLAVRVFAIPLDRDQSVRRGYAELIEGFALGLRLALAMAECGQKPVNPATLIGCWALGEAVLAAAAKPVPAFVRDAGDHDRAPRMADLDMTLAGIA